ncbi:MAG: hypothetical protein CMB99_00230 [Flavobacteriaceae bacterium]|nr:hypothetical protein [Flavobacteriaceae bacterium]
MDQRTQIERFEQNLSPNTLWLVQRLFRTEQAKPGLVEFIGKVMNIPKEEALRFFKRYKDYVDEQPVADTAARRLP